MNSVASISNTVAKHHLEVRGSNFLSGQIKISGAKNSALVLMAATLLTEEALFLKNIPSLTDINVMSELLSSIGVRIERKSNEISLTARDLLQSELPYKLVHALRASFVCAGPLLARIGEVSIPLPGGCRIGNRPIEEHIRGLEALGASVSIEKGVVKAKLPKNKKKLKGAHIKFNCQSVGATETILMAATLAEGRTVLENSAQEPEIQDLANMLNSMGAQIRGAGTKEIIIEGVEKLNGCNHTVIPDRIEAGTFLIAAAITRSSISLTPVIPEHLEAVFKKLRECGCLINTMGDSVKITPNEITAVDVTTSPYPGFPTDLQAPFMALMTTAKGTSKITETVFEKRMQHVSELNRMGSSIKLLGNTALITGVPQLTGTSLSAGDLRASAAMVLASLSAKGVSKIIGLDYLDRGYERMEDKLKKVGADISREKITISANKNSKEGFKPLTPQSIQQEVA
ncbi:UDP-N-acetylglucosamine 1-carboxyvinyltransferase [Prochlorococcus marinus]|nr:UDP-N-acetylglucosamine 1-carboxyvinyltransferase [Prochlorococcus marinus]